tara:strand:- start:35 stop:274 length:240 start_codon:yes stop_codon:yes gene_type:complete
MDIIEEAIKKHGAKAVYNAAVACMEGNKTALPDVDLGAANMGVAYSIMLQAHQQMSAADQAANYWDAQSKLDDSDDTKS